MTAMNCLAVGANANGSGLTSGTAYLPWAGDCAKHSAEASAQRVVNAALTLQYMSAAFLSFSGTSSGTLTSRNNTGVGNMSCASGSFVSILRVTDTTHSDSIAHGDNPNTALAWGSGSVAVSCLGASTYAATPVKWAYTGRETGNPVFSGNGTDFAPMEGVAISTATFSTSETAQKELRRSAVTASYLQIYVLSSTTTSSQTFATRNAGAAGNQACTITAGAATTLFSDTTHSDSWVSGDAPNYTCTMSSSKSITATLLGLEFAPGGTSFDTFDANGVTTFLFAAGYYAVGGDARADADETGMQSSSHVAFSATNLRAQANLASGSPTLTFRNAGADGNQTISFINGTVEDTTHSDSVDADAAMNSRSVGTASMAIYWIGYTFALPPPVSLTAVKGDLALSAVAGKFASALRAVKGSLALSGKALKTSAALKVVKGGLALSGYAAKLSNAIKTVAGALGLSGKTSALASALKIVKADLALTGHGVTLANALTILKGALSFTGYASPLTAAIRIVKGALNLTGFTARLATAWRVVKADLVLSGQTISFSIVAGVKTFTVIAGALALSGYTSLLATAMRVRAGGLVLKGYAARLGKLIEILSRPKLDASKNALALDASKIADALTASKVTPALDASDVQSELEASKVDATLEGEVDQ